MGLVVRRRIGKGAFASIYEVCRVYLAVNRHALAGCTQVEHEGSRAALKLQRPPCVWEFYVLRALHTRCPPTSRCLFGTALRLFNMPTSTGLLLSLGRHGTLQDLVNAHLRAKMV